MTRRRILFAALSLLVYAGIYYLSSLPPSELPSGIPDVIPHVSEYALLAFFLVQVFPAPRRRPALAAAFLLTLLLGLLDEVHQLFTPGRVFSLLDVLCDGAGAILGLAAFAWFSRRRKVGYRHEVKSVDGLRWTVDGKNRGNTKT